MNILGVSAHFHDAAAALISAQRVVAAAAEERFSRRKHDSNFPYQSIASCLATAAMSIDQIDAVVWHEKPLRVFDRVVETHAAAAPWAATCFAQSMQSWIQTKGQVRRSIRAGLGYRGPIYFSDHHLSHAASAFYPSPFDQAAILTIDGVGQWSTTTIGRGHAGGIEIVDSIEFPHSLGLLYSAATAYVGFRVNGGEYELMGLAAGGQPRFVDIIEDNLCTLHADGSFTLKMSAFDFIYGRQMHNRNWRRWFGPPRRAMDEITQTHRDIAASFQRVLETAIRKLALRAVDIAKSSNLCLAGGVAMNCVAVSKLLDEPEIDRIYVQPAAGDGGAAIGAAMLIAGIKTKQPLAIGNHYHNAEIETALRDANLNYESFADRNAMSTAIASKLASGKIVARFDGPMEFGPRALGHRSILADPRDAATRERLNATIKFRQSFRPFAPAILADHTAQYFLADGDASPAMTLVAQATPLAQKNIPAAVHVDGTSRFQTVTADRCPDLHGILKQFHTLTGVPAVINTSFNVRWQPIVRTPREAIETFADTDMDVLAIGSFIVERPTRFELDESEGEPHSRFGGLRRALIAIQSGLSLAGWIGFYFAVFAPLAIIRRWILGSAIDKSSAASVWSGRRVAMDRLNMQRAY